MKQNEKWSFQPKGTQPKRRYLPGISNLLWRFARIAMGFAVVVLLVATTVVGEAGGCFGVIDTHLGDTGKLSCSYLPAQRRAVSHCFFLYGSWGE